MFTPLDNTQKIHHGVLPQRPALESCAADMPKGSARNGHKKTASVQHARGERLNGVPSSPSRTKASAEAQQGVSLNLPIAHARIFALDRHGKPLMPCHPARARKLLKAGRARIHKQFPFTIRLMDRAVSESQVQPVVIKFDPGSRKSGLALIRQDKATDTVLFLAEIEHRGQQVHKAMTGRSAKRRRRRSANLRYRQPRFDNRTRKAGWLPPSVESRVNNILSWTKRLSALVPIAAAAVERVRFDTQLMQNAETSGVEYQQGTLAGFEVRQYLLEKFNRACAYCGETGVPLEIDHVQARSKGGSNRVSNLTLACHACNQAKGNQSIDVFLAKQPERLAKIKRQLKAPLSDAAAVNVTRYAIVDRLRKSGLATSAWSGGRTKFNRTQLGLPKTHALDAVCVGDVTSVANWTMPVLTIKAMGRGSYQRTRVDKFGFPRGVLTRVKQVHGFQTGDMVKAVVPKGKKAGVHVGRVAVRARGSFNIQTKTGVIDGVSWRYCTVTQRGDGYGYAWVSQAEQAQQNEKDSVSARS